MQTPIEKTPDNLEMTVLAFFAENYEAVYRIDLSTGAYEVYACSDYIRKEYGADKTFSDAFKRYCGKEIVLADRERMLAMCDPEYIRGRLKDHKFFEEKYRSTVSGTPRWWEVRVNRLGGSDNEIVVAFADRDEDIRREKGREEALERALEEARRAEKAKSYFFSTVSHDIRTPLNAIVGFSEILKLGVDDPDERKRYINSILVSSQTLLQLINDVLDLSKLEVGKMEILPQPTDLSKLVSEIATSFEAAAGKNGVEIIAEVHSMPLLEIDPQRIRQILFNLVGNAVKFTEKGHIKISAKYEGGSLYLEVEDTGCGISEEDQQKIASPYVQVGNGRGRSGGTGLGLAICKQLVFRMDGEIELASALGKGTTFFIKLPKIRASLMDPRQQLSSTQVIRLVTSKKAPEAHKVLIADDSPVNLAVLRVMLSRFGVKNVVCASNGRQALELMQDTGTKPPDTVLTDMWMPEMDGEQLARAMHRDPRLADIPIYVVTADVEAQKTYANSGFTGVLLKPITFETLREIIV